MNKIIADHTYRHVLSIAGSDSGGGAGIQADLKAISACGCYAMTVITAVTAQNTVGVRHIFPVSVESVEAQMDAVLEDLGVDAVKLGMLPDARMIEQIAARLRKYRVRQVVLDPVMVATSGDRLIDDEAAQTLVRELFPLASLVTPNLPEAEYLSGIRVEKEADLPAVAQRIQALGASSVLLKAGHSDAPQLTEHLYTPEGAHTMTFPRVATCNTHGTGCTLSSAIAAFLAQGHPMAEAVAKAEAYVHEAIEAGASYRIGAGHGPVHHFYPYWR
ncbi:MAG: bifunctional hydroxymethylpyrimidine kinase/phosphomethylpyrimidine kinase [Alistipes sp.]|nr:bifunctional hydroxymethylpyrimidine kinase/phosphomethylpyrimidine kinase [Alistipes sp.]